ncbi:MAG: hypothetical protein WBD28_09480 [Candidatus Zixiibacteriota bacterium]
MMDSKRVKEIVKTLGADLCGIVPAKRFSKAPEGFRPTDIYKDCKSVVVFAKKVPASSLNISSCVPYTLMNNIMMQEVDRLGMELSTGWRIMGLRLF